MIDMFEYLAITVAMWQDSTLQAEEENDMTGFLDITAATIKRLHPFFVIKCVLSVSEAQSKYQDVATFKTTMNANFYTLMAALNEDEAIASMRQIEKSLCYSKVISISKEK